ncbi:MAG: hypothetical protein ACK4Z6_09000 [Candidatus Methylomirabilales bacterium]
MTEYFYPPPYLIRMETVYERPGFGRAERRNSYREQLVRLGMVVFGFFLLTSESLGQPGASTTHIMTAIEVKGATTTDKLAPPPVNPKDLSKGYGFKAPGEADKLDPKKWEVSSYRFAPGFMTVLQGDTVKLIVFAVNGDEHEVRITDPDGREVVAKTTWNRGREYEVSFVAENLALTN